MQEVNIADGAVFGVIVKSDVNAMHIDRCFFEDDHAIKKL